MGWVTVSVRRGIDFHSAAGPVKIRSRARASEGRTVTSTSGGGSIKPSHPRNDKNPLRKLTYPLNSGAKLADRRSPPQPRTVPPPGSGLPPRSSFHFVRRPMFFRSDDSWCRNLLEGWHGPAAAGTWEPSSRP